MVASAKEEMTMRYLALLGEDESAAAQPDTPAWDAEMAGHMRFSEVAADAIHGGEALQPVATAMTVRHGDGGEPLVTTGPYAETTEALGGFYVLEAGTLDDAIDMARRIPTAESGWVALRPLVMWQAPDGDTPPSGNRYLAVIYGKESPADQPDTPAWDEGAAAHGRFVEGAAGAVLAGGAVHPVDTTTTVQVRDGELLVTDGALSEAAEIVGGLYVLGAPTTAAAVDVATAIPVGPGGAIEVRPVMDIG
jgi:hypothetical protein